MGPLYARGGRVPGWYPGIGPLPGGGYPYRSPASRGGYPRMAASSADGSHGVPFGWRGG